MLPYPDISPQNRSTGFMYKVKTCEIPPNSLIKNLNEIGDLRLRTLMNSVPLVIYHGINIWSRLPCFICRLVSRKGALFSVLFSCVPTFRDSLELISPNSYVEEIIAYASLIDDCGENLQKTIAALFLLMVNYFKFERPKFHELNSLRCVFHCHNIQRKIIDSCSS